MFRTDTFKTKFRFNFIFSFILVLSWFSPTVVQAVAFRDIGTLPPLTNQFYTQATTTSHLIEIVYSTHSSSSEYQMPISRVNDGNTLLFSILVPPGTGYASLNAESNFWQGPLMKVFEERPIQFCGNKEDKKKDEPECEGTYTNELKNATGGFTAALYGDLKQKDFPVLEEPTYRYFVLYQRPGYGSFEFSSLTFRFKITDTEKYMQWWRNRPWNGGSGNIDGIGETTQTFYRLEVIPPTNGSVTINPPNIQCNNAAGIASCNQSYITGTPVTLTASADDGFRFVNWNNDCSGTTSNATSLTMDSDKTCSAKFEEEEDIFNLNEGNQEFGNEDTLTSFDQVKIVVTTNIENENSIFEPVTRDNKETKLKITSSNRSIDINAIITPNPEPPVIDIVVIAGWDDNQGSIRWYQKTKTPDMFSKTGWVEWIPDMSKLQVTPYVTYENLKESYSVNVFTGRLVPPTDFSQAKQVHFYVGYGFYDSNNNKFVYVVSQPLTFQLPVAQ